MLKRVLFLILLLSFLMPAMAQGQDQESNLKAVFIYNFTQYIDWGTDSDDDEFIIGIMGSSIIDRPITEIAKTNRVRNRKIVIRHFSSPEDIRYCHILFIPHNCPFSLQSILEHVNKGVLTISEEPGFASKGTAFNFVLVNDKLKFEVNLKSIYTAGLKAGSQLLKLAIIID